MSIFDCTIEAQSGNARVLRYETAHGDFTTPMFMPVGTHATVKGITSRGLHELNSQVVLANTYHLYMRPGVDVVEEAGGVQKFMDYDGPMLTDSGGFQLFSLDHMMKTDADGVSFQALDYDGSKHRWTPEDNMRIQERIGADIAMQLDQCVGYPAEKRDVEASTKLSWEWAERCLASHHRADQALFGIVQGGMHLDLRLRSVENLIRIENESVAAGGRRFDGFGIGGYSVGESHEVMFETLGTVARSLPDDRPRYLMGVGNPTTLVRAVGEGVDMFDCVLRAAHTHGANGHSVFEPRSHEHAQCEIHARFRPSRSPVHVRDVHALLACLHPPFGETGRDARRHPAFDAQPALPHRPHAPCPRGNRGGRL